MNQGRTDARTDGQWHGRTTRKHIASAGAYRRRRLKNGKPTDEDTLLEEANEDGKGSGMLLSEEIGINVPDK